MRLATVQSATTVRLEGATADSKVWRWGCPPTVGHIVATETFGTQLVVVASLTAPAASSVGLGAGMSATASQSIATGTVTQLVWQVDDYDDGGWIDGGTIVVPEAGRYLVSVFAQFDGGNATGYRDLFVYSGSSSVAQQTSPAIAYWAASVAAVVPLAAGAVVSARINQSSGGALNVLPTRRFAVSRVA